MASDPLSPAGSGSELVVSTRPQLGLRVGELVQAVVQARSALDTVVLNMRGAMIDAKTTLPLMPGQTLALQVDALGPEIRLRIMPGPEQARSAQTETILASLAGLKNLAPAATELKNLAGLLNQIPDTMKQQLPELDLLKKLLLSMDRLNGETLGKAISNSGVFLEAKLRLIAEQTGLDASTTKLAQQLLSKDLTDVLMKTKSASDDPSTATQLRDTEASPRDLGRALNALIADTPGLNLGPQKTSEQLLGNDLKAVLLKAQSALEDPAVTTQLRDAGINPRDLGRTLNALVNSLEYQQLQSKLGDSLQLFLPLLWHGLNEEWVKFKSKGGGTAEPTWSCTINLDLERVGKLRSQVLLQTGYVHVKVFSDNPAFVDAFKENQELLNKQFSGASMKLGNLSVSYRQQLDFSEEIPEGLDLRV